MLEVDIAFARQGGRGRSGSLKMEEEKRLHEFKCWEMRTLQICAWAAPLEAVIRHKHLLIEVKSLLTLSGKMIEEQYKIKGIAQAETVRHKRDLWTFIERSLRIKKSLRHCLKTVSI